MTDKELIKTFNLELKILNWAKERGIFEEGTPMSQGLKTLEEVQELLAAINQKSKEDIKDAIGDIYVTLIIQSKMNDLQPYECLQHAYDQIKNRSGKMIDGVFVKEEDNAKN